MSSERVSWQGGRGPWGRVVGVVVEEVVVVADEEEEEGESLSSSAERTSSWEGDWRLWKLEAG